MKKILVLLLVLGALVAIGTCDKRNRKHRKDHDDHKKHDDDHDDDDHYGEDYEALQKRLDLVTSRLHHLDDELDRRFDPELRQKALSLEYRVEVLEEPNCDKDHYDCGPQDHECVSRLMVCDGHKDCRNGDDEAHCNLPTKKGDHFEGEQVYENCTESIAEKFDFTVTAVKVHSDYPAFPIIRAILHFAESTDEDDHEIALPTVGYYRYSSHKLVLRPPQGRGLGLVCDFDGHNEDRCVGDIMSEGSLTPCSRYIFHRQDEDDDDDDDDHDDDHDDHKNGKNGHNGKKH
jgi:hypothetical protein